MLLAGTILGALGVLLQRRCFDCRRPDFRLNEHPRPGQTSGEQQATSTAVPDRSVVILAINERENLELLLPSLWEGLGSIGLKAEVIVVDGDRTTARARPPRDEGPGCLGRWREAMAVTLRWSSSRKRGKRYCSEAHCSRCADNF